MFFNLFGNSKKPDFWKIRESFIEYVEFESDVLEICDFAKKRFAGIYIGYNPDSREKPEAFLSAGINHFGDTPEKGTLKDAMISAYWTTFPTTDFANSHYNSHYFELEPHCKKIQEVFGFDKLDFNAESAFLRIGVKKIQIDLTDKEHIHSHFK